MPRRPIPADRRAATPYLVVDDAARALAFYRDAFDAVETLRLTYPDGRIGHAEFRIGEGAFMLADEHPDLGFLGPRRLAGTAVGFMLYVEDADASVARAVQAGASTDRPLRDEFHGDRVGDVVDPFGHRWTLATRIEDVSSEEIRRRFDAAMRADSQ
jgi:PhnB protein